MVLKLPPVALGLFQYRRKHYTPGGIWETFSHAGLVVFCRGDYCRAVKSHGRTVAKCQLWACSSRCDISNTGSQPVAVRVLQVGHQNIGKTDFNDKVYYISSIDPRRTTIA